MIGAMSGDHIQIASAVSLCLVAGSVYLRWPGRTVGVATGGWLILVGLVWPGMVVLAVTLACAGLWRWHHPEHGRGLLERPRWACFALSAAVTVLAPGWWVLAGLGPLVVSTLWLMSTSSLKTLPPLRLVLAARRHRRLRRAAPDQATLVEQEAHERIVDDQATTLVREAEDFLRAATD